MPPLLRAIAAVPTTAVPPERRERMESNDTAAIVRRLVELRTEHRDLDLLIQRLSADGRVDQMTLTRSKKRKLRLKDEISWLENKLIPDLNA